MGKQPPAFQFYGRDFDASTKSWELAAVGAYTRLLIHQWECGGVPDDIREICRVVGAFPDELEPIWESRLREKFPTCKDGKRRNSRLERVREAQMEYRKKKVEAGRKSAEVRRKKYGSAKPLTDQDTNTAPNTAPNSAPNDAIAPLRTPLEHTDEHPPEQATNSPVSSLQSSTTTPKTTGESDDSPPARAREDRDQEQGDELPEHKRNFLACVNQLKKYTDTEIHGGLLLQWAKRIQPEGLEWIYMELADRGMFDELKDPKELKRYLAGCVKNAEKEYAEFEKRVTPAARRHAS